MSRKDRFTPQEKEQACIEYIEGNRTRSEICRELLISTRTIQDWVAIYNKYRVVGKRLLTVVFHSNRHTSVTYKLKLSGGDIKAIQRDSGRAQADMVTEVYGHIID